MIQKILIRPVCWPCNYIPENQCWSSLKIFGIKNYDGSVSSKLAKTKHLHLSAKKEMFKGHCFPKSIILHAVYLKLRFSLSYRDIEELMAIRGVKIDHATIQRWVFKFAPLVEKQFKKRKKSVGKRWRMD